MPSAAYVSYQWLTSQEFLLPALRPDVVAVEASPDDDADELLTSLPPNTRWFHFHLNCTRTSRFPVGRAHLLDALAHRGITTINAAVTDISKTRVQQALGDRGLNRTHATPEGDGDELVIVKTDLNFGGDSEWALTNDERERIAAGEGSSVMWKPHDYRILRRDEVPEAWWHDRTLVVERYVVNRHHRWYRVFIFGSCIAICELVDSSDIKKVGHSSTSRVWLTNELDIASMALPGIAGRIRADVLGFKAELQVEFGAIDVVVDDEANPFIIDLNTTPAYGYPVEGVVEHLRLAFPKP